MKVANRGERGVSMPELLIVVVLVGLTLMVAVSYSLAWLNAEEIRSSVYQTQMLVQLARVESVTRNRACDFTIDSSTRSAQVHDLNDLADTTDDITLANVLLSSKVNFASPDGNPAISLTNLSGTTYQALFASDGSVTSGAGVITLQGKDSYQRVSLFAAGGTKVQGWDGTAWKTRS